MKELTSPAREILDHLLQHPEACDTFEGIAQWWLLEQHLRSWIPRLDEAVADHVQRGLLEASTGPDGVVRYRGNRTALTAQRNKSRPPSLQR